MESEVTGQAASKGTGRYRVTVLCGLSLAVVLRGSNRTRILRHGIATSNSVGGDKGLERVDTDLPHGMGNIGIEANRPGLFTRG